MPIIYYKYYIHNIDKYILEACNIIPKSSKDYHLIEKISNKFYIYIKRLFIFSKYSWIIQKKIHIFTKITLIFERLWKDCTKIQKIIYIQSRLKIFQIYLEDSKYTQKIPNMLKRFQMCSKLDFKYAQKIPSILKRFQNIF